MIVSFRELIKLGFKVRAGVRNAQKAGALVQVGVISLRLVVIISFLICIKHMNI